MGAKDDFGKSPLLEVFDDAKATTTREFQKKSFDLEELKVEEVGSPQQNMMADLAEFWNEIEGLSKEEQSERIQEEYGDHPEILEMLKQILNNKDHNQDDLKRIYDSWKNQGQPHRTVDRSNRQAQFEDDYHWYSKDLET